MSFKKFRFVHKGMGLFVVPYNACKIRRENSWEIWDAVFVKRHSYLWNVRTIPIQSLSSFGTESHDTRSTSTSKRATLLVESGAPSKDRFKCTVCTGVHSINQCDQFLSRRPRERYDVARQLGMCINCLRPRHNVSKCQSSDTCKLCGSKHNNLLHF